MKELYLTCIVCLCGILLYCNPAPEKAPDPLCNVLHPVKIAGVCHGQYYWAAPTNCNEAQCHGANLRGGNAGGYSCYSCHLDRWTPYSSTHNTNKGGELHNDNVGGNPYYFCAGILCHGVELMGSPGHGRACADCHGTVPIFGGGD